MFQKIHWNQANQKMEQQICRNTTHFNYKFIIVTKPILHNASNFCCVPRYHNYFGLHEKKYKFSLNLWWNIFFTKHFSPLLIIWDLNCMKLQGSTWCYIPGLSQCSVAALIEEPQYLWSQWRSFKLQDNLHVI